MVVLYRIKIKTDLVKTSLTKAAAQFMIFIILAIYAWKHIEKWPLALDLCHPTCLVLETILFYFGAHSHSASSSMTDTK